MRIVNPLPPPYRVFIFARFDFSKHMKAGFALLFHVQAECTERASGALTPRTLKFTERFSRQVYRWIRVVIEADAYYFSVNIGNRHIV